MLKFWEHAIGSGQPIAAAEQEPFACSLEQAQQWCNFAVLRPEWLPPDCSLGEVTVRPESLKHPSSLRLTVTGGQRSLRLKQFYMDWWIPTSSDTNLTGPGRPFIAAGIVGYLGRDYKGQQAACIHRLGSVLELSVLEGQFLDEEIQRFFDNLQPQLTEAAAELSPLPFARLSYYARKGPGPGPWNYDLLSGCSWSAEQHVLQSQFAPSQIYLPRQLPRSFVFDSVGTRHEPASHHWEYQLLFRSSDNWTDNIWLRAVGEETEKILWIAPGLDRRMGIHLQPAHLPHRTVRVGSTSQPYGEQVAQWMENHVALEVHARASQRFGPQDFLAFLDSLFPS